MKRIIIAVVIVLVCAGNSKATQYVVLGTQISILAESAKGSTAHLIQFQKGMFNGAAHPVCDNRAYILLSDKELFATALAAAITGRLVNVIYDDGEPVCHTPGHGPANLTCRVISIYW